eukprot:CAMPEP_0173391840 /NCGR_PEP_ID=MMETSP1356-20130122/18613_1 /TAXON_ID=77927 ORGANISM="Hemiselmis virescens, Strain PCC157" /NCGR_SAMPLE_ID=MMETSP1356 /ASSEMBLY_ACC=CAM_ASM_000847 /LENGTH=442 /DNA_ID=CAMNT_0014349533 /DNA_START=51 /DNA_END=1379 /DNA_ORIENTATION=+
MAAAVMAGRDTVNQAQPIRPVDTRWTRATSEYQNFQHAGEAYENRDATYSSKEKIKVNQCNWRPVRYDIYDYYDVGEELGRGSSGVVKRSVDKATGNEWAVKMIELNTNENEGAEFVVESLRREIEIMKIVDHPSCVALYEVIEQKWRHSHIMFLTLELLGGGDLFDRIQTNPLTERDVACMARDLLRGLKYLHENSIVHRDVKPENLLFASSDPSSPNYNTIKISDFGLAAILSPTEPLRDMCGTPGYVAPEVLNPELTGDLEYNGMLMKAGYSTPVDIWSMGVMVYECLCGSTPFHDDDVSRMLHATMRGAYDFDAYVWLNVSEQAKQFIRAALVLDPYSRQTAEKLLEHEWVLHPDELPDQELEESTDLLVNKRHSRSVSTWDFPAVAVRHHSDSVSGPSDTEAGSQIDWDMPIEEATTPYDRRVSSHQEGRSRDQWRG